MEIVYTDIYNDLTEKLLELAKDSISKGKRVFYIVPSSISFEKEKEILERFSKGQDTAIFDLLVTRFKQLPWYFPAELGREDEDALELSNIGQSMLFKRVIKSFSKEELPLYYSMGDSYAYLESLVNLREELIKSNLTTLDLLESDKTSKKITELVMILDRFDNELANNYANFSEMDNFLKNLEENKYQDVLKNTVIIIDGYSRFSAEEEKLINHLSSKVDRLIIGSQASQDAFNSDYIQGNVYENSVEMMRQFEREYKAKVDYFVNPKSDTAFSKVSRVWEAENDARSTESLPLNFNLKESEQFEIWQVINQKEEIEYVAKNIRHLLAKGVRYQDILVLVGDLDNYRIKTEQIFNLYDIPYFYAQEEYMRNHPLILILESLVNIKKYNYRFTDVVNLLKVGLYNPIPYSNEILDEFEYYLLEAANIRGRKKFSEDFKILNPSEDARENIERINTFRRDLVGEESPLQKLLTNNNPRLVKTLISDFSTFLKSAKISEGMNSLFNQAEELSDFEQANRHQQVWDLLMTSLREAQAVFKDQKMTILEFLETILAGLLNASYRGVPANVDVVNIKDYTLVEPSASDYVFAIGLSQSNFPKVRGNTSLLSDDERLKINESLDKAESKYIDQPSKESNQKNISNALSLFNSARKKLILSTPQLYELSSEDMSPYLKFLIDKGVKTSVKKAINLDSGLEHVGNYKGLLSSMGTLERMVSEDDTSKSKLAFWRSCFRLLAKNEHYQKINQAAHKKLEATNISSANLHQLYPENIYASVSAFENFYNCQYQYFLANTLKLRELDSLSPDSRKSGLYFHKVFEKLLKSKPTSTNFSRNLEEIMDEVYHTDNNRYYFSGSKGEYLLANLKDMIRQTSPMLEAVILNSAITPSGLEEAFGFPKSSLDDYTVQIDNQHELKLRGVIDRIDAITNSTGVVDYKSGPLKFDLNKVFSGRSLQFMTYLDIISRNFPNHPFGATYLQVKNNPITLSKLKKLDDLPDEILKDMSYKGIYNQEYASLLYDFKIYGGIRLKKDGEVTGDSIYSTEDLDNLVKHNEKLYRQAANKLLSGELLINPVVENNTASGCSFCKFKSICKFEADSYLGQGRKMENKSRKDILESLREEN